MTYLNSKPIMKLKKKPRLKLPGCAIIIQWNLVMINSHAKPLSPNKEKLNFFTLSVTLVLTSNFTFNDKYKNKIEDKPEVDKLVVITDIVVTDVKLCVTNGNTYKIQLFAKYTIKTTLGEQAFIYYVIIKNDDKGHGNGPYDFTQVILKPKNASFVIGNYEHFTLELISIERIII